MDNDDEHLQPNSNLIYLQNTQSLRSAPSHNDNKTLPAIDEQKEESLASPGIDYQTIVTNA